MKLIILMAFFTAASASFMSRLGLDYFSSPKSHEYAICVNTVQLGGSYTYNDDATVTACQRYNTKENNKCADCKIVKNESTHCRSENKQINKKEIDYLCKEAGADRSLSN